VLSSENSYRWWVVSSKTAAPVASMFRGLGQRALASGGLSAVGGAGGAGAGALIGGARGYRKAKEEGQSGVAGALRGGVQGAVVGGTLGAAGGAAAGMAGGGRAQSLVRGLSGQEGATGAVSRFGERQVHSMTGAMPAGGLRAIGASPKDSAYKAWKAAKDTALAGAGKESAGLSGVSDKTVGSLRKAFGHAKATEELGMTSLPGAAKAFATSPVQALKAGVGREWHGNPTVGGKLMAVGLPGALVVNDAVAGGGEDGSTVASRGLASAGMAAPFSLTPMGFAGATAASAILGSAGERLGMLGKNKKLGGNPSAPVLEDPSASSAVQRELSPRASGELSA
jgi:hypothetical protein